MEMNERPKGIVNSKNKFLTLVNNSSIVKHLLLLIFVWGTINSFSQSVGGKIIDADSKIPLEYVNIGVIGRDKGTVCDKNGLFLLELSEKFDNDTLRISLIGYYSISYRIWDFKKLYRESIGGVLIELTKKIAILTNVNVGQLEFREKEVGNKGKLGRSDFESGKDITPGLEIGTVIKINKTNTFIEKVSIVFKSSTYDDSVTFRINIYSMNKGLPGENILKEPINFSTKIKDKILTVDLGKYNIYVDDDILVSLEWLEKPGEKIIGFGTGLKSESFMRATCESRWDKFPLGLAIGIFATILYTK
jgi:hypothetical protein